MLCPFGLLQNGSVATGFIHFSSTVTGSATNEYVTLPERIGNEKGMTLNNPIFPSKMYLNDAQ